MEPRNTITIKTEDNIIIELDPRIGKMSDLFSDLISNYDLTQNKPEEKMERMYSKDLKLLIDFCSMCNYEPIVLKKPLWKYSISYQIESFNDKLKDFYSQLDCDTAKMYINISDFYTVPSIDEIIYLKLHEILTLGNEECIKAYFKLKPQTDLTISKECYTKLYDKYNYYFNNFSKDWSDEEINDLCLKLL